MIKRRKWAVILTLVIIQSILLSACKNIQVNDNINAKTDTTTSENSAIKFNGNSDAGSQNDEKVRVGIAWRQDTDSEFYTNIVAAIIEAGGEPILLKQVIDYDLEYENGMVSDKGVSEDDYLDTEYSEIVKGNTYHNSNVKKVIANVDAVIFTGGEDISPKLLEKPEEWIGIEEEKDFNATRDVSDYLLMSYCIDNNIPTMGFCRGMQMLSVVSGAQIIQDLPTFFENNDIPYNYEHRNQKATPDAYRDYAPHDIEIIDENSHIYDIFNEETVQSVPSWHHQAVKSVDGTALKVTSVFDTNGYDIIECVERTDKDYIVGYQFHPEAAVVKNINAAPNADDYMSMDTAMKTFVYFIEYIEYLEEELNAA